MSVLSRLASLLEKPRKKNAKRLRRGMHNTRRRHFLEPLEDRRVMALAVGDVIINEVRRDTAFTTTESVELLLTKDISAADLGTLYIGDSTSSTAAKFGAYQLANLSSISSVFKAGTILALGGSTAIPVQDTAYNPLSGASDDDWNLKLQAGGSFLANQTGGSAVDFAATDVVWIDTSLTGTTSLHSINWDSTPGTFGAASSVTVSPPGNPGNIEYLGNGAGFAIGGNYAINSAGSLGLPNGGVNTSFIASLRNSVTPTLSVSVSPSSVVESTGAAAATGTVTRTGDLTSSLLVSLTSSDETEGTVPLSVTIPANEAAVAFDVAAVDDTLLDGPQTVTLTASAGGFADATATLTVTDDEIVLTPVYAIQGSGAASPLVGQVVTTIGVVVADFQGSSGQNGFYLQDEAGDGLVETSDGIFVFVPVANPLAAVNVNVGDRLRVTAQVREFNTLTELEFVSEITVLASGLSIAPTPIAFPETANNEVERYEGMLVGISHAMTVQQNFFQGRFGQVTLASGGRLYTPTNEFDAGSPQAIALADENARRLLVLDDSTNLQNPNPIPYIGADNTLRAGDGVTGLVGVIDFGSINSNTTIRDYRLQPTAAPSFSRTNQRTDEPTLRAGNLKGASFNVLNYFTTFGSRGASNAVEFERQSDKIVSAILAIDADVLGLIELENNGSTAIGELVTRLNAEAGAGTYAYVHTGVIGTDAIAVGLIYQPSAVTPVGAPAVDLDPIHNRPPVAQTFRLLSTGEKLTFVVNHFKSKNPPVAGEVVDPRDLDQGDGQGNFNYTRTLQAERLLAFLQGIQVSTGDDDVLILGDINAYAKEDPIQTLEAAGYVNQVERYDANAYSFIFDGQSGSLDHVLASPSLVASVIDVETWHINADEPSVIDYQTEFKPQDLYAPHAYRSSDHDPAVVSLYLPSDYAVPAASGNARLATFNASLNRNFAGQLLDDLSHPDNPANSAQALRVQQAKNVAEVIQRVRPDVVLINEFDYDPPAAELYRDNFLEVSQNGALPIEYPYLYIAPSNTGIASGFDLNNNGQIVTTPGAFGYGDDALGFGNFVGQFGMLLLSKYEIISDDVRTFQNFLWKDMPGAKLPDDSLTPAPADWYSPAELAVLPLSSKSHWDVPIRVGADTIHVLASHPTPPVFDGPEDRNGKRNFDEIRLWADYVTPHAGNYIYDDAGDQGGLAPGAKFVIMGDQNSDPLDGDSIPGSIQQLLNNPRINTSVTPDSEGGPDAAARQGGANNTHLSHPRFDTADFADGAPGNLRADYVLPSRHLRIADAQVFWPKNEDPFFHLVGDFNPAIPGGFPTSDHRLVWVDIAAPSVRTTVSDLDFLGEATFPTATMFNGTTVGGLSGLAYDELANIYYAISDDRSQLNPARYYTLDVDLADGSLEAGDVSFIDVTTLLRPDGTPFPTLSLDPEGIALAADGSLYISSEGQVSGSVINPFVNRFSLGGLQLSQLPIPAQFLPDGPTGSQTKGIRNNLAFESLTISPDGRYLFTAVENALFQDGPAASRDDESAARIVKYDLATGQPVGQFVYFTDTVATEPVPAGSFATNGLVELLALDNNGTFLALERSFSNGVGNSIKLYQVFAQGAMDVSNVDALADGGETLEIDPPVRKELLLDLSDLGITLDNLEGMALGPKLDDGRQSLILVSDNNFSTTQFTQFLAFAVDLQTTPLVDPVVETPPTLDGEDLPGPGELAGDADDPAVWVHPTNPSASRVIATLKDGGLVVFDLAGNVVQKVQPGEFGDPRFNNVDLIYGFEIKQGNQKQKVDLAVVSDRENDTLAIYKIDAATGLLSDVAHANLKAPGYSIFGIDDGEATAYGLTSYTSPISGKSYVFVSQADGNRVAQLELKSTGNGKVTAQKVRELAVPVPSGEDLEDAQVEGMVADRELGWLYVGQEGFGIYKYHAEPGTSPAGLLIESIDDGVLLPDLEGLTIYYAGEGAGYLLASSQGDSTYAVFAREGNNAYLGSFGIGDTATIDQANESDGADVINVPLGPAFPFGALIVQDGANDPQRVVNDDGELENVTTNFKFIPWEHVASAFPVTLAIDTESFDPRDPTPNSLVNGVAAGDVTTDSAVLWTRSTQPGKVRFQVYKNANFTQLVETEDATVTDPHKPVKVLIDGLKPGTQYYYRATDAAGDVATGRFRTANPQTTYAGLRFGVSGDWRGELAPYPAVSNADEANLDFFVALGDTIYADVPSPDLPQDQATSLLDYRIKNAEVYGTRYGVNTLADLRASTSILATIDDHEVTNDFAGGAPIGSDPRFSGNPTTLINDSALYNNGLTAFQEFNPIADEFYGATGDPRTAGERKLYRANTYGLDAAAFVLDARSFRDQELPAANPSDPASMLNFLISSFNPARTMLGDQQVADLKADLLAAQGEGVTWKFIFVPEPIQNLGVVAAGDRFEGYAAERTEILKFIHDHDIQNVVFVAADIHGTLVNNLTYQEFPGGPQIATTAFEITTGAVAYDQPFGQTVVQLAAGLGLLAPAQVAFYNSLPIAGDGDSIPNDKDDFLKSLVNGQLAPLGYDPVGLNANLSVAAGLIDATLIQGDYASVHTYGWTDFQIDPETQELRVITYGIEEYTVDELNADPESVLGRTPTVVSEFVVRPTRGVRAGLVGETLVVRGDGADNEIEVRESSGKVQVFIDGDLVREINKHDVERVEVHGLDGNDDIVVHNSVNIAAWLFGGDGNDTIVGGKKNTLIVGGDGDDTLLGGRGQDVLIGGMGADVTLGEQGEDVLIGGKIRHDDDRDALDEIFHHWTGPGSYEDRIDSLAHLLDSSSIEEDNAVDILLGGQGHDWFLVGIGDLLADIKQNERVN